MTADQPRPLKEAIRITKMLDIVFGEDRFDRHPVDVALLAREYSAQIAPNSPIHDVEERNIPGCMGALIYSESHPRQWGIVYHKGQTPGRRAFTIGHEFGHYVLHRGLIETGNRYDGGVYCDEESVVRRNGGGIEKEADAFAATLLMPFHDFRRQLPANDRPDFNKLSQLAARYGVSLIAVILRWLEYTETRAIMIVSNEGFAHWARSSEAAFKSGRFIRTKQVAYPLPPQAKAVRREFSEEAKIGILQPEGAWGFPERAVEMCIRSDRYDLEITLLHFDNVGPVFQADAHEMDVYDRFAESGQLASLPIRR